MGQWRNQRGNKNYFEMNENGNIITQSLWDSEKAVLRGKFMARQAYLKKKEKSQVNNFTHTHTHTKRVCVCRSWYNEAECVFFNISMEIKKDTINISKRIHRPCGWVRCIFFMSSACSYLLPGILKQLLRTSLKYNLTIKNHGHQNKIIIKTSFNLLHIIHVH